MERTIARSGTQAGFSITIFCFGDSVGVELMNPFSSHKRIGHAEYTRNLSRAHVR